MSDVFKQYIKAIGRGQRSGRYLTEEEAFDAMRLIMQQQVTPEQLGAFLMLLRVREEHQDELAGFVKAIRQATRPDIQNLDCIDIDFGCYAGKRRHLPWFVLAIKVLAENGYRVLMHGTQEPESERLYLKQVFQHFNWPIAKDAKDISEHIQCCNLAYIDLADINTELDKLIQMRSLFGLRSAANSLARMLNPSRAKYSFHGVFHRDFDARHIQVAALLGDQNVACIRGEGGEVEVNPEREVAIHLNRQDVVEPVVLPNLLESRQIKPRELDLDQLKLFWQEQLDDKQATYARAAVIGSLSAYLVLLEALSPVQACTRAEQLWAQRNRNVF
ncbi:glycosyl transferase family protein [Catenovulum sp. SM1970]|uniref:glycosyl transferase family protein n=1 Tax=Marinifaba aquimaris TaxID=2741323 RepID=UPI001573A0B9|nr:glycosyl transferase family protein [Marinifaba aquimaris]NTS76603.1 glycosyl transferase family protein [Marinifaba aquimaris]